ncbi:MAG: hypothetical protein AB7O37_08890 [Vicinamibacteria bacterium]
MYARFRSFVRPRRFSSRAAVPLAALALAGAPCASAGEWKWAVTPYAWATDVGADVELDDRQLVDTTIPVTELIGALDATAQVQVEAQHGEHGLLLDLFDVRLSEDKRIALPASIGGQAAFDSEVGLMILEIGGFYDRHGDQQGLALLYGARILHQSARIDARFDLASGGLVSRTYDVEDTLVDAMIGVRHVHRFSRRWSSQLRADVSSGGTDLSWSAGSSIAYAFGRDGRYALQAGYRRMVVEFKQDGAIRADMTLSGLQLGFRVAF